MEEVVVVDSLNGFGGRRMREEEGGRISESESWMGGNKRGGERSAVAVSSFISRQENSGGRQAT